MSAELSYVQLKAANEARVSVRNSRQLSASKPIACTFHPGLKGVLPPSLPLGGPSC